MSNPKSGGPVCKLMGGYTFTKIDLSHAYLQLSPDNESKKYIVINTHKGLFRYTHLSFRQPRHLSAHNGQYPTGHPGHCGILTFQSLGLQFMNI